MVNRMYMARVERLADVGTIEHIAQEDLKILDARVGEMQSTRDFPHCQRHHARYTAGFVLVEVKRTDHGDGTWVLRRIDRKVYAHDVPFHVALSDAIQVGMGLQRYEKDDITRVTVDVVFTCLHRLVRYDLMT